MEWWHVYLFTRLDSVNCAMNIGYAFLWLALLTVGIIFMITEGDIPDKVIIKKYWLRCIIGMVAYTALCIAIPSQKEAAAIFLLPKLAHSDFAKEAQQLPTDAAKLMRLKLESWIADMDPKKAEKK